MMRLAFLFRVAVVACIAVIAGAQTYACKCASNFHGKNSWEVARQEAEASTVIFEGVPEHLELQWNLLNAKEGELIPVEDPESPRMVVTFLVQRAYKGTLGPEIQIKTGVGGGDCGAVYVPGLTYLVFGDGLTADDLQVSMCSPGGWVGGRSSAVELRYLRKEQPLVSDLAAARRWTDTDYAEQEEQSRRAFEEDRKRYEVSTGKICGTVVADKTKDGNTGILLFLSTAGYSPADLPTANINPDGSFCSQPLGPGKYYVYFIGGSGEGLTSAAYDPGVSEKSKAAIIEVNAGQTRSDITFNVPTQKTYSVRGFISTNDKSGLTANSVYITLINLDCTSIYTRYGQSVDFKGSLPLPKTKYFNFENVLPGHYVAYVSVFGRGWFTKKVELNVTTHMKLISLELVHKP